MTGPGVRSGLAVPLMVLGSLLAHRRENRGLSRGAAGAAIGTTEEAIAELEDGRSGLRMRDLVALCDLYQVDDHAERVTMLGLAAQPEGPAWWAEYRDLIPPWLDAFLGLEQAAGVIRGFEVQHVPGLLQTEGYARAVIGLGLGSAAPPEAVERRVRLRMRRQEILCRPGAPHAWLIIDEGVLCRPVGGSRVMFGQIEHLIDACAWPNVTIQVLPFDASDRVTPCGPVTLLRLHEDRLVDIAYLEDLLGGTFVSRRRDVDFYRHALNRLAVNAEPADRTAEVLRTYLSLC